MSTKVKSTIVFAICIILIGLMAYIGTYGLTLAGYEVKSFGNSINKGLDLQGGVTILEEIVSEGDVDPDKLAQTKELLELRVNKMGVSETSVTIEGKKRIRIDIPGQFDAKSINETLVKTGKLVFKGPDGVEILTGADVTKATGYLNQDGEATIGLEFNADGTKKFADATQKFLNQKIAIYLDEDQLTNPNVINPILDGKAVITGSASLDEAKRTAGLIQSGALPVVLKVASVRTVGATLGESAIPSSLTAAKFGLGFVLLFMMLYYRVPGILADLALVLFVILVLLTFVIIGAALTLPGIAGLLLSIGMAVDANVLIFERIKEELKTGKSIKSSVNSGFHRALSSILDSNITTVIAAIVLYFFGSGAVKGFALTLIIGVIISMFSAITVTKLFMKLAVDIGLLNKPSLFGVKRG